MASARNSSARDSSARDSSVRDASPSDVGPRPLEDGFLCRMRNSGPGWVGKGDCSTPLAGIPAEAIAAEWAAQTDIIDPMSMPFTRLVNTAIDAVAARAADVAADVVKYAGSDLLYYRADHPRALVDLQAKHWDPVLAWAQADIGGRFILSGSFLRRQHDTFTLIHRSFQSALNE